MKRYRLRAFFRAVFWAVVIASAMATTSRIFTRIHELQAQINQLKSERVVVVEDTPKLPSKKRRVK